MWTIEITCILCYEAKRTRKHDRCTSLCNERRHYGICHPCEKRWSEAFDKAMTPFVYINVEEDPA